MEKVFFDTVVIGCGVVGLSVARMSALSGFQTLAIEKEKTFGSETSSRNSEVVHAGIYYRPTSLKAELCVSGKQKLYQYCEHNSIPFQRIGKFIVATNDTQRNKLLKIRDLAEKNGVSDLLVLDSKDCRKIGTSANINAALYSPSTGIVDSHAFMQQLEADFVNASGITAYSTSISTIEILPNGLFKLYLKDDVIVECKNLVNAAGLNALDIRKMFCNHSPDLYSKCFKKGNYFSYSGKHPFKNLVYPIPEEHGLGIHLTLDLNGKARFGPDVENCENIDYSVSSELKEKFYISIKQYWPEIDANLLHADYSGIRPKVLKNGLLMDDFIIETMDDHGHEGAVNLLNIESPGLTASLAIAEYVGNFLV